MRHVKTQRQSMSTAKVAMYGLLTWAIPFVVSIPLMGGGGQPVVPIGVFKSIMVLVGAATGACSACRAWPGPPVYALLLNS